MQLNATRAGIFTTEFYASVATILGGLFLGTGHVSADAADPLANLIVQLFGLLVSFLATFVYTQGRVQLKKTAIEQGNSTPVPTAPVAPAV